jgi:hypothetical protein
LTEFLSKTNELFPDSERKANTIFSSGDCVISEWTLRATKTEPFAASRGASDDASTMNPVSKEHNQPGKGKYYADARFSFV